jgi:hypothetical protein
MPNREGTESARSYKGVCSGRKESLEFMLDYLNSFKPAGHLDRSAAGRALSRSSPDRVAPDIAQDTEHCGR